MANSWGWDDSWVLEATKDWDGEATALFLWARWAGASLDYLDRLDDEKFGRSLRQPMAPPHRRRLGACPVGRRLRYDGVRSMCRGPRPQTRGCVKAGAAVSNFFAAGKRDEVSKEEAKARRAALPPSARRWLNDVNGDPEYRTLRRARHPFTHRRLPRIVPVPNTQPGPHEQRQGFPVGPKGAETIYSRDLITKAKNVALQHVGAFGDAVKKGTL